MTSLAVLKREIEKIKQKQRMNGNDKPDVVIVMQSPDRGDGKEGWTRINLKTGEKRPALMMVLEKVE